TAAAAGALGTQNLLLLSALLLGCALAAMLRLIAWSRRNPRQGEAAAEEPLGGSILAGARAAPSSPPLLRIGAYLFCYTALSASLYFQQGEIVGKAIPDAAERTRFFATVDFTVNALSFALQLFATARLVERVGAAWMLALMPLVSVIGFAALGAAPTLAVLV